VERERRGIEGIERWYAKGSLEGAGTEARADQEKGEYCSTSTSHKLGGGQSEGSF